MRISDWSSDVCSSDLRLGACFERRGIDGELGEHAAQPGGVNLILVIAELHHRPLLHATLRRKVGAVSSARGSSSRTGCRVMTYCGVEADRKSTRLNSSH